MKFLSFSLRSVARWSAIPALALLFACNNQSASNESEGDNVTTEDAAAPSAATHAEAIITGTYSDTTVNGTAKFDVEENGKVKLVVDLDIPAKAGKPVAVHIHEHGDCGDQGNMSHGHWNPTNQQHGKWGSASFHSGDIGNVDLDKDGKGSLTMETDLWTIGGDSLKNILGKALIVHGGVDDYTSQPSGNAGSRIGCGVIQ